MRVIAKLEILKRNVTFAVSKRNELKKILVISKILKNLRFQSNWGKLCRERQLQYSVQNIQQRQLSSKIKRKISKSILEKNIMHAKRSRNKADLLLAN